MDFRDPKVQKIAIACVVFFILVYFWYSRVYSGQANQIEARRGEYQSMIINLRNVEMKSKSLEALRAEYGNLLVKYREIEQLLPEVKMVPSFLVQLHTASSLTGTKIISIRPMPLRSESFYNVVDFEVKLVGTYNDFGKFVGYIANFPFIVNVNNMNIETPEDSRMVKVGPKLNMEEPTIKARFTLSTYFVKAEERLQELEI